MSIFSRSALVITVLVHLFGGTNASDEGEPLVFTSGVKALFCGHSFFIPVSTGFEEYALQLAQISPAYDFPDHNLTTFFSGGASGSPLALWNNDKDEIEALLQEGDWELFGLTIHNIDPDPIVMYRNWFDLALSYNPDVMFFIGMPWFSDGAITTDEDYANYTSTYGAVLFDIVETLRAEYAPTPILFLHYGHTLVRMRELYDSGNGPLVQDVPELLGLRNESIYRDVSPGHAGDYAYEMSSLLFMNYLYDISVDNLVQAASTLDYNTTLVQDILEYVLELNEANRWNVGDEDKYLTDDGGDGDGDGDDGGLFSFLPCF